MSGHVKNILKRQKTKWDEHSALTSYEIENEIYLILNAFLVHSFTR